MRHPKVTIENYREAYEHFGTIEASRFVLRSMHRIAAMRYKTKVEYAPEAEKQIEDALETNTSLIFACNHLTIPDQFGVAAAVQQEDTLRPIIGNTFIVSKPDYFQGKFRPLRPILDRLGTIPVFREKDMRSDTTTNLQREAGQAFIDVATKKVGEGKHMFIFPEGTRNKEDRTKLLKLSAGLGVIACASSQQTDVAIAPLAIWYGDDLEHTREPRIYFNTLMHGPFENRKAVNKQLSESMQESLNHARLIR